jgi:hypothetical protein
VITGVLSGCVTVYRPFRMDDAATVLCQSGGVEPKVLLWMSTRGRRPCKRLGAGSAASRT